MSGPPRPQPRWSRFHAQGTNQPRQPDPTHSDAATGVRPELSLPTAPSGASGPNEPQASEIWPAEVDPAEPPAQDENPPLAGAPVDDLPRAFQLRRAYVEPAPTQSKRTTIFLVLGGLALLAVGGAAGYLLGSPRPATGNGAMLRRQPVGGVSLALSDQAQAAVDAAFEATKQHRYQEAQAQFDALYKDHPEWPSMAIESARAALYGKDFSGSARTVSDLMHRDSVPDADFLLALAQLIQKKFVFADEHFAAAVALDPARADIYYFWGECLRSEGKPREAANKYQSALTRNQFETAETLFQLKLWLSLIQSDQEESSGANAKIDAALATLPRPPYSALFAAAARSIKAGGFKEAADWITKGQQCTEPLVFRVVLQDPLFVQESWRPELKNFYR